MSRIRAHYSRDRSTWVSPFVEKVEEEEEEEEVEDLNQLALAE